MVPKQLAKEGAGGEGCRGEGEARELPGASMGREGWKREQEPTLVCQGAKVLPGAEGTWDFHTTEGGLHHPLPGRGLPLCPTNLPSSWARTPGKGHSAKACGPSSCPVFTPEPRGQASRIIVACAMLHNMCLEKDHLAGRCRRQPGPHGNPPR